MSWDSILSACIALLILIAIMGVVFFIYTAVKTNKQKKYFANLHGELKKGQKVMFAGGLYGTLKRVGDETCDCELKDGTVVEVSRYSIQEINQANQSGS